MGTPFRIVAYAADTAAARRAINNAFARIEVLEQSMSDYRADSEINRLVTGGWQRVSPDLYAVLRLARRVSRRSRGAFDVSAGPLTKLWRRAIRQRQFPGSEAISGARSRVRWKWVRLRAPDEVKLARQGMQLDFGGIAKGYALDAAGEVLRAAGIRRYLIDGGGDVLLGDPPPGAEGWLVETPTDTLHAVNEAIVTSGNAYRYLTHAGHRYGHIVDPRTGVGTDYPGSVTVRGPRAVLADALASAAVVSGKPLRWRGYQYSFSEQKRPVESSQPR